MKTLNLFLLGSILTLFASCDSNESINDENANDLKKIVTITTNSANPSSNTKNIKHYVNFEVVSDSTFDYQNNFMHRRVITTTGLTKTIKQYLNTGELMTHMEENYDSQGRLVGRHTYDPTPSALYFTYVYNSDGTVTSKYYNELDGETTTFRTFTKNAEGLIFKQNYSVYNFTTGQVEDYESNANLQNQKLVSVTHSGITTSFQYYPNTMPTNLLKSVNELNNLIIMGNELRYLAYNGNSYYKVDDDVITNFNSNNYKTYSKSVYTNTSIIPNETITTERFYYYE